ncbi:RagB/SusD family nutrient uptake outer membrane protein [Mariniphaga sediminis]|uniref:RagB/SusD family nutrient uptake outer membrane protein n=1 Tax=Mariniphaga sediminis TaxID=1628158 RepID=A0A399CXW9_9BACT|nr:RagB/SusD family nutrient uptake outer membrane protein [Mariniphaga sediminis]RIH64197.1 RagB/SusD family nutrient uptake outer membrane protein [Mariniphaga sediminis]RIH66476.1 RagB/SusD family nutrient uptake outer membrane protein [Mariniphaga sediminis]
MKAYIVCFILVMISLVSCKDELLEKPYIITQENFYNTKIEAEAGIAAIFPNLRSAFSNVYLLTTEASTDVFIARDSWGQISLFEGLDGGNRSATEGFWKHFYRSIRNANIMIHSLPEASGLSEDEKNRYIAEARFLRAFAYFHLVRCWGGVPLRVEDNMDAIHIPRSSAQDVYQLIIDDLLFAENNLPDSPPVAGRGSKWTAKAVLADVYFMLHDNTSARNKAEEIIQSGEFALVEVRDSMDFYNVFGKDASGKTQEEIFYIKYSQQGSWSWPRYLVRNKAEEGGSLKDGGYWIAAGRPWMPFYTNWDENDLRKAWNTRVVDIPARGTQVLVSKFRDLEYSNGRMDYPLYRYADILLLFAEADCLVQNGPTAEGMEALNMVRRRAYGYETQSASPVDFLLTDYDKEQFLDLVLYERGKETYAEGKRWFDLLRSGKFQEIIKESYDIDVQERHLLWPIPNAEINFNDGISASDNNPGF